MKKTLSTCEIADELLDDKNAGWTRAGAFAMAEYLEACEEDSGEDMELDVVALRCDYGEHESLLDWAKGHFGKDKYLKGIGIENEEMDEDEIEDDIRAYIQNMGQLIEFDGGIIVSYF
jgi:hypothetical protein